MRKINMYNMYTDWSQKCHIDISLCIIFALLSETEWDQPEELWFTAVQKGGRPHVLCRALHPLWRTFYSLLLKVAMVTVKTFHTCCRLNPDRCWLLPTPTEPANDGFSVMQTSDRYFFHNNYSKGNATRQVYVTIVKQNMRNRTEFHLN